MLIALCALLLACKLDAGSPTDGAPDASHSALDARAASADANVATCDAPEAPSPQDPPLQAGPIVGSASDSDLLIWARAACTGAWGVQYAPTDDPTATTWVQADPLVPERDFTGVVRLAGLDPGRSYDYEVRAGDSPAASQLLARNHLRTLPDRTPGPLRVLIGADIGSRSSQPIFAQMQATSPDAVLLVGDQIYADDVPPTVEGYSAKYRRQWRTPELAALMASVPMFMIWDDHDIQDNYWPGKGMRYMGARGAYDLYVEEHNPPPRREGELYYSFRLRDVAFYVLDTRSHRSPNPDDDTADKSLLGPEQKADLKQWLMEEDAALKVIVSSVTFSDWSKTGKDSWKGFQTEREEIFAFLVDHNIDNVLLVTGDQHWSALFRYDRSGYVLYEFEPTPLAFSRGQAPTEMTDEIIARDDDNEVFGVLDIDTAAKPVSIAMTLCADGKPCHPGEERDPGSSLNLKGDQENVPFTVHITTDQLGRPAP